MSNFFKKAVRVGSELGEKAKKTAMDIGADVSSTIDNAKKTVGESTRNLLRYEPEDFSHDYFKALNKIRDIQRDLKEKQSEVTLYGIQGESLQSIKGKKIEQGTVIYSGDTFFVVNTVNSGTNCFTDINGMEHLLDESNMFVRTVD